MSAIPLANLELETTPTISQKKDRLSKRKSSDDDVSNVTDDSIKNVGTRKSARLSMEGCLTVRFVDTIHSISTIEGITSRNASVSEKFDAPCQSISSSHTKSSSCSEPSLVNKLFAAKDDDVFAQPTSVAPMSKRRRANRSDQLLSFAEDKEMKALPKKPNFPKLAEYIGKDFYKILIEKMRPKYGIETNARVLALARYIKNRVDEISKSKERYPEEEIEKFQRALAEQGIVRTPWDFFFFALERFPVDFRIKAFPPIVIKDGKRQLRDCTGAFSPII